jgi:hypothetical protein
VKNIVFFPNFRCSRRRRTRASIIEKSLWVKPSGNFSETIGRRQRKLKLNLDLIKKIDIKSGCSSIVMVLLFMAIALPALLFKQVILNPLHVLT